MPVYKAVERQRRGRTMGKHRFLPNNMYEFLSPSLKIALSVLEKGIRMDRNKKITYSHEVGKSWLSRLERDLEQEVSRVTISQELSSLLDKSVLTHGEHVMELVVDGERKAWVRAYHVGNEYVTRLLRLYQDTHYLDRE